jgi:hypothetical protein
MLITAGVIGRRGIEWRSRFDTIRALPETIGSDEHVPSH